MTRFRKTLLAAAAMTAGLWAGQAAAQMQCAALADIDLPRTTITTAEMVTSGAFDAGDQSLAVPEICRVAGVVEPAIKFEVWLPAGDGWNGRLQSVGGGGLAGIISYPAMAEAARAGYATASTDTGHEAPDMNWVLDSGRVRDYGYRAIHEMTEKAKALIEAHYGRAQDYAYFNGCSTGGRQGLMEAQRFPDDYDGIISGAPVMDFTNLHIGQLWTAHATLMTEGARLHKEDFNLITDAVLDACDAADGVKDGFLTDPRDCDFDPAVLQCKVGEDAGCLSAEQVEAVKKIYQGAVNPRTGVQLYPGLAPGSEGQKPGDPGWGLIMTDKPFLLDYAVLGGMAFGQLGDDWNWRAFDFDQDVDIVNHKLFGVLNAVSPDLRDFESHGGKVILYHGWNDPGVMPQRTIDYYEELMAYREKARGSDNPLADTQAHQRLFMMPGVGHCRGGSGPDQADFMAAIVDWVENDTAPERIIAVKQADGETAMTRPLCAYPEKAHYTGSGDTDAAENFECR